MDDKKIVTVVFQGDRRAIEAITRMYFGVVAVTYTEEQEDSCTAAIDIAIAEEDIKAELNEGLF